MWPHCRAHNRQVCKCGCACAHCNCFDAYSQPYSALFEIDRLSQLHPVVDLHTFLGQQSPAEPRAPDKASPGDGNPVDLVFSVLRGSPPQAASPQTKEEKRIQSDWVEGDCKRTKDLDESQCVVGDDGAEVSSAANARATQVPHALLSRGVSI